MALNNNKKAPRIEKIDTDSGFGPLIFSVIKPENGVIYVATGKKRSLVPGFTLAYFKHYTLFPRRFPNQRLPEHVITLERWQDYNLELQHVFDGKAHYMKILPKNSYSQLFLQMVLMASKIMNGDELNILKKQNREQLFSEVIIDQKGKWKGGGKK